MSYGFLTEDSVFYSYKLLIRGKLVSAGDGYLSDVRVGISLVVLIDLIKELILDFVLKGLPSLVNEDLSVVIVALNRV